ncbi:MAG: hypothetical protein IJ539_01210 [Prevotella sp.]|nr:hypothetical protein [Prevotella sp.]
MDSFILYRTELDMLLALKAREGLAVLRSLMTGEEDKQLTEAGRALFNHMKEHINTDKSKYEKRKNADRERIRRYRERNKERNVTSRYVTLNDNVNDKDKEKDNDKENEKEKVPAAAGGIERGDDVRRRKQQQEQQQFKVIFNDLVKDSPIPKVQRMTDSRWAAACACRKRFSWQEMQQAIRNATLSPALTGRTKVHFLATYDWLMQEENMLKCLEGNYKTRDAKN